MLFSNFEFIICQKNITNYDHSRSTSYMYKLAFYERFRMCSNVEKTYTMIYDLAYSSSISN